MKKGYKGILSTPLGEVLLYWQGTEIKGLWFIGQKYYANGIPAECIEDNSHSMVGNVQKWLDEYFEGDKKNCPFSVNPNGTEFQKTIWGILLDIPYGKTRTYGEVASRYQCLTGKRTSPRAVGNAVSRNPVSILIPCHRVMASGGRIGGYAGGIQKKQYLLELEMKHR